MFKIILVKEVDFMKYSKPVLVKVDLITDLEGLALACCHKTVE